MVSPVLLSVKVARFTLSDEFSASDTGRKVMLVIVIKVSHRRKPTIPAMTQDGSQCIRGRRLSLIDVRRVHAAKLHECFRGFRQLPLKNADLL